MLAVLKCKTMTCSPLSNAALRTMAMLCSAQHCDACIYHSTAENRTLALCTAGLHLKQGMPTQQPADREHASPADQGHMATALAREASQRSVNAQGDVSQAASLQSAQSSTCESPQTAQRTEQLQCMPPSQHAMLDVQSQRAQQAHDNRHDSQHAQQPRDSRLEPQRAQHAQQLPDRVESCHVQHSHSKREGQVAQIGQQAQHAQSTVQSGFTTSVTLSARMRQISNSAQPGHSVTSQCSATVHSSEATSQVSFHATLSPSRQAKRSAHSVAQLFPEASSSHSQRQRLPAQLLKQLPEHQTPQLLAPGLTDQQDPTSQQRHQQGHISVCELSPASEDLNSLFKSDTTTQAPAVPQAAAAAAAAAADVEHQPRAAEQRMPAAGEQTSAVANRAESKHQPANSTPAMAVLQPTGRGGSQQQGATSLATHSSQQLFSGAVRTRAEQGRLPRAGSGVVTGQAVSRTGSLDRLQHLMLLTSHNQQQQQTWHLQQQQQHQHQQDASGSQKVNSADKGLSRAAVLAAQPASSYTGSPGKPSGDTPPPQGSAQGTLSQSVSTGSGQQCVSDGAASACSHRHPMSRSVSPGNTQQRATQHQQSLARPGSIGSSQQSPPYVQSLPRSMSTGSTQQAGSSASQGSAKQAQHAQQAGLYARTVALLQEQSQQALGVQPSYEELSREGLEEDNCRLRYALAAIEQQLGILTHQQVGSHFLGMAPSCGGA